MENDCNIPNADDTQTYKLIAPGTKVSNYTVAERLGIGGIGEVYLAHDVELDRSVAIKFLKFTEMPDPKVVERFKSEAYTAAKLNHPNIVTVYEIGDFDDRPYVVQEFIDGEPLNMRVYPSGLSVPAFLSLAIQICDGLSEAHANRILHGDLKPSNILIDHNGRVKIIDLGISEDEHTSQFTDDQTITGTTAYMPPEQLKGLRVDERSDLFSLGVVLYEVLTLKHPFRQHTDNLTMNAIMQGTVTSISKVRSGVPAELEKIIMTMIDPSPENRPAAIVQIRSQLIAIMRDIQTNTGHKDVSSVSRQTSIAVLPFMNIGGGTHWEHFCQGISEEILVSLASVEGLRVTDRGKSFSLKNPSEDICTFGRDLNVEIVLKGSVRINQGRLIVSVQLVETQSGYQIWSKEYNRMLGDVFDIQDEIAESVVHSLKIVLGSNARKPVDQAPTNNVMAYDYFLRGRQYFHQRRKKSLQFAVSMLESAVDIDPNFAYGFALLAHCCSLLVHFYGDPRKSNLDRADKASQDALRLAPALGDAHAARGFVLWLLGDHENSDLAFKQARQLSPKNPEAYYLNARSHFQRGLFASAAKLFEKGCRVRDDHEARYFLAQTYASMGREAEARTAYVNALHIIERHVELHPDDARAITFGAVAYYRLDKPVSGLEWAQRALDADPTDAGIQYNVACLFALEGDQARAISCLKEAVKAGFAHRDWVMNDPDLRSLRSNPEFMSLNWRE
ncbi:MAG: protein kinase [candidate division Zixibacteria bacterium]|nr:protein kinase [candidate division Zixibacteria bacterium]